MFRPLRPTRRLLLPLVVGGALHAVSCLLVSRVADVSGGALPDAASDGGDASDASTDAADAEAPGPGCACATVTIAADSRSVPSSLAVDPLQSVVYWTTEHLILRCPSDGCG